MKKTLIGIAVVAAALAAQATNISWSQVSSGLSWDDDENWSGGVKPGPTDRADLYWKEKPTTGSYTLRLGASQEVLAVCLREWTNPPSPLYIGTETEREKGYVLSLQNLIRQNNISGDSYFMTDFRLTGEGAWAIQSGYNGSVSVNGVISGSYGIVKSENGTLIFNNTNTYTGATVISGGKLQLGNGSSLTGSVAGSIENNATLIVNPPRVGRTVLHEVTGTGAIEKLGTGTLVFSGTDSLSSSGSFKITQHHWQEPDAGFIDCTKPGGGTLSFGSYNLNGDFTFLGSENLDFGSAPVSMTVYNSKSDRYVNVKDKTLTMGGAVSGALTLHKTGRGTLRLTAANTYSKPTKVDGGTLLLSGDGTVGTDAVSVGADGSLVLDNGAKNADRIGDALALTLGGGLTLKGNGSEATAETLGALTLATGPARVSVEPSGSSSAELAFASYAGRSIGNTTIFSVPANASVSFSAVSEAVAIPGALVTSGSGYAFAGISQDGALEALVADGTDSVLYNLTGDVSVGAAELQAVEFRNDSGASVTVTLTGSLVATNGILFSGSSPIVVTGGSIGGGEEAILLSVNTAGVRIDTPVSADNITYGGTGGFGIYGNLTAKSYANGYITINTSGSTTWAQKNNQCGAFRAYAGTTTLATGAKLYEKDSNSSGSRCYFSIGANATFDMNGVSAQVNGIAGAGSITNSADSKATLTCKWSSGNNYFSFEPNFSGSAGGNLAFTFTSDGYYASRYNQTLSGDSSFTGGIAKGSSMGLTIRSEMALGTGDMYINSGSVTVKRPNLALAYSGTQYWKSFTYAGGEYQGDLDVSASDALLNDTAVTVTVSANSLTIGDLGEAAAGRSLTKAGAGTLTVKGDCSLTGGITVSAGTLKLCGEIASNDLTSGAGATLAFAYGAKLNPASSIDIDETGKVDLGFDGTQKVKSLIVAGEEMPANGTYGGIGSGARHELDCLKGIGKISMNSPLTLIMR